MPSHGSDRAEAALNLGGVRISHPDKIWWPDEGITKGDVARFYAEIFPRLRPWLNGHPLTAERCPDGIRGQCFFQKDFADVLPVSVPRVLLPSASAGKVVHYVVGGSRKTQMALVNLGCIAIHVMNCRRSSLDSPEWLAFDLDPQTGRFSDAAFAGRLLDEELGFAGLASYPKTSGGRGLHVLVPLRRSHSQEEVRGFARMIGERLARRAPSRVTIEMSKARRGRKVFADALRNAFGQTIVTPYSVRCRARAPISTPLRWQEVTGRLDPARFNLRNFSRRLEIEDPWADFWTHRQRLPS